MTDFVFSEYVRAIKAVWKGKPKSDPHIITVLCSVISQTMELDGKGDYYIECSKSRASEIMNRHANPHEEIRRYSQEPLVRQEIVPFFEREIISELFPTKIQELRAVIADMIANSDIFPERKQALHALSSNGTLAQFLSEAYIEVLQRNNVEEPETAGKAAESESIRFPRLESVQPPDTPSADEHRYIDALMDAYGEDEGVEGFTVESLATHGKHKKHYDRMRQDYYAAESVNRGMRDAFAEWEDDEFRVFEEEIYEGVVDTYEDDYHNGMARLREVLKQASQVSVQRSWLSRNTDWIGAAQKKGVCHFLVNDGRLEGWVDKDE